MFGGDWLSLLSVSEWMNVSDRWNASRMQHKEKNWTISMSLQPYASMRWRWQPSRYWSLTLCLTSGSDAQTTIESNPSHSRFIESRYIITISSSLILLMSSVRLRPCIVLYCTWRCWWCCCRVFHCQSSGHGKRWSTQHSTNTAPTQTQQPTKVGHWPLHSWNNGVRVKQWKHNKNKTNNTIESNRIESRQRKRVMAYGILIGGWGSWGWCGIRCWGRFE